MAHYNNDCLCVHCTHLRPALDPNIQQAYLGKCMKREWPFTLAITLQGWMQCEAFEESGKTYVPPEVPISALPYVKPAVAAAGGGAEKVPRHVEFYYSSTRKPGDSYPCDVNKALELVKRLQVAGVDCKAIDVAEIQDCFPIYHKSVTGPDATVRPVFGFKGALADDFGTTVPALLVFEGERYPTLAFPRNDAKLGLIRVEQALENLLVEESAPMAKAG
jgi:hypothetical protein